MEKMRRIFVCLAAVKLGGWVLTVDGGDDEEDAPVVKDTLDPDDDSLKDNLVLSDWAKRKLEVTATFAPGEEDEAGKVTITPVGSPDKAFMRVVIPKDPGVK